MAESEIVLQLEKMCKTFPGVIANDNVDLDIRRGEIHALLGENGAGKTTLTNCVYGVYQPTSGKIIWKGEEVEIHQARDAIALGIGMVHQHFMLVPPLTVAENVVLGMPMEREPFLNLETVEQQIREQGERYHLRVDPTAQIWTLPVGVQQRVEILKALYREAELLILDEPTAVLTPGEVEDLFLILKKLTDDGLSIIFITHKLEEVMAVCNRVTVLRDGILVNTVNIEDTSAPELAKMMVGREVFLKMDKPELEPGEVLLKLENVNALDDRDLQAVKSISFEVHANEILGVAGVDGNGQTELASVIVGMRKAGSGKVFVKGEETTNFQPIDMIKRNVAYISPDRHHEGLLLDFTITENLIGKTYFASPISKGGIFSKKEVERFVDQSMMDYDVRAPGPQLFAKLLSGGNQQKVILARELSGEPDVIIAAQPARGLDIGATEYVHKQMIEARNRGAAVLLISTELEEILSLSDRIAVMYEGEVMGIIPGKGADTDIHELGELMAGLKRLDSGTPQAKEPQAEEAGEA
ncbi:MAG: ABC transporter ATP-binding protein [Chloroflexi bacterium]|jgi:general nucleoside transport system ATP-binding protein|nr:ABC transporter ATP-binding protein [Chloroflexota bacterium]